MKNPTAALPLPLPSGFSLDLSNAANNTKEFDNVFVPREKQPQLWLSLYFPQIILEVVTETEDNENVPQAVIVEQAGGVFIHSVCDLARQQGVTDNMSMNAAYALCPELKIFRRNEKKEAERMSEIADWALSFTSQVSIVSVDKLLLEIKGSLRLFSGLSSLLEKLEQQLSKKYNHRYSLAVTPTPLASQLLSEIYERIILDDEEKKLHTIIGNIPLESVLWNNKKLLQKIKKTGVKDVQDFWRLPRDGLARRFGPELLKTLDQLIGDAPDPRSHHSLALHYEKETVLPMETTSSKIINWHANVLFEGLEIFLCQRDTGVVHLSIHLKHQQCSTELVLRLRQMTRSAAHMCSLFIEKMERTRLPSAVYEISISVNEILPFISVNQSLFNGLHQVDEKMQHDSQFYDPGWSNTLEQLQNRLGKNAVKYLQVKDEIHPDWAWCYQLDLSLVQQAGTAMRPLWLLAASRPLNVFQNRPQYLGALFVVQGPERIQSGWWQGESRSIARDYYIALSHKAGYLWIYRDLKKNGCWYLHGFFG